MKDVRASLDAAALPVVNTGTIGDYVSLTKPRLNVLVVATSAAGYYLGSPATPDPIRMALAVAGTALVAAGAAVFNQVMERRTDALMRRTSGRPLPDGRVAPAEAWLFGGALSVAGLAVIGADGHFVAAGLAAATLVIYAAVYTPLKRRTPLATLIGAVPGALPPLIGWTASRGAVTIEGLVLFGIVFVWQIPHFMAIAWMYRDDYARAGFPMLPVLDPTGRRAGSQAVIYAAALLPVSAAATLAGLAGTRYLVVALALGLGLLWLSERFASKRTNDSARHLFVGSIAYLPILWIVMIADRL